MYESKFNNSNDEPKTAKISAYTYWNNCFNTISNHEARATRKGVYFSKKYLGGVSGHEALLKITIIPSEWAEKMASTSNRSASQRGDVWGAGGGGATRDAEIMYRVAARPYLW